MQLVFFDLLLQKCDSLLIEFVLVFESLHDSVTYVVNLLEMSNLAMTFLYKDLFLRELAMLDGDLIVVFIDDTQ